jgi:hypothetical protein
MNNKCFNDIPESFNKTMYSSDSISSGLYPEFVYMSCTRRNAIYTFVAVISAIATCGIVGPTATFVINFISNLKTTKKVLLSIFKEIISNQKAKYDNNDLSEEECRVQIINSINDRVCEEFQNRASERVFIKTLKTALEEEWPTIHEKTRNSIIDNSFDGLIYKKCCERCKICTKNNQDDMELRDTMTMPLA